MPLENPLEITIYLFLKVASVVIMFPGAEIILLCLEEHVVSSCLVLCNSDSNLSQEKSNFLECSCFSCSLLVCLSTVFPAFTARICLGRQNK